MVRGREGQGWDCDVLRAATETLPERLYVVVAKEGVMSMNGGGACVG